MTLLLDGCAITIFFNEKIVKQVIIKYPKQMWRNPFFDEIHNDDDTDLVVAVLKKIYNLYLLIL